MAKIWFGDLLDKKIPYDGKKYIWNEVYFKLYKDNFPDFKIAPPYLKCKNGRYVLPNTYLSYNNKNSNRMEFSGDIIFNFITDPPRKPGIRRLHTDLKKILTDAKITALLAGDQATLSALESTEARLAQCVHRTEMKANVSLMPCTGRLQVVKYSVGRDRFDTYLWCLSEHYNGNSVLYNHCSAELIGDLRSFLDLFKSVYEYCECIYNLDPRKDKPLIDDLIASGSKPIDTWSRVDEYTRLAERFWASRIAAYKIIGINHPDGK
jgi:hypothetical protein